jgi:hypothetical protein
MDDIRILFRNTFVCPNTIHRGIHDAVLRLKTETTAIRYADGVKPQAVNIPPGAIIATSESIRHPQDRTELDTVKWDSKNFRMFLLDLLERSERVQSIGD